jgi:RNA methyltransferase, TrmH family
VRLTSTQNPIVKYVRSLDRAVVRRTDGVYLVEGIRLTSEALDTGQVATHLLYDPSLLERTEEGSNLLGRLSAWHAPMYEVTGHILDAVSDTESPAGIAAVLKRPPEPNIDELRTARFGIVLDRVADPGNAGTIVRTAAAVGADYVVAAPGSADLYSAKALRAGMGGHFRLRVFSAEWHQLTTALEEVTVISCEAHAGASVYEAEWPFPLALLVGSEAHGLSEEAASIAKYAVRIPMAAGVESLNASVAAAIVMYQALGPGIDKSDMRYT